MNGMEAGCRPENPHKKEPRKVLLMDRYRGQQVELLHRPSEDRSSGLLTSR